MVRECTAGARAGRHHAGRDRRITFPRLQLHRDSQHRFDVPEPPMLYRSWLEANIDSCGHNRPGFAARMTARRIAL
jgi:hypothetical protein